MTLSIITINYNNLSGLRKTVESVFAQTYCDFEYIIVDGASTDGSKEYLDTISAGKTSGNQKTYRFTHLQIVSEPDTGIYNAMNKGIRLANGEYCLFLNSGDFFVASNVLEMVFSQLVNADILCAKCNVSDKGKVIWTSNPPHNVTFGTLWFVGLAHQSTFIKRALFDAVGLYDETYRYNADTEFWYRAIIIHNATTQRVDVVTTDYNLDGVSATHKNDVSFKEEHRRIKSNPLFAKFIPDYEQWRREKSVVNEYVWINSHPVLRRLLHLIHHIVK